MKSRLLIFALCMIGGIGLFQNCSNVNFSPDNENNETIVSPHGVLDPSASPTPTTVVDIGKTPPFKCTTFKEIVAVDGQSLDIPARDPNNGLCFVVQIMQPAHFSPSSQNPNRDNDVVSANHDINQGVHSPYVLGSKKVDVILHGERSVILSGGKDDSSPISVDNFLLVGIAPAAEIGDPKFFKAYGSGDVVINDKGEIQFKTQGIVVTKVSGAGAGPIAPLMLQGQIELDRKFSIDVRALDAGYEGHLNNSTYLLFK